MQLYNEQFETDLEYFNRRHLLFKHQKLYPSNDQLEHIQTIITDVEKALKLVSDKLCDELKADSPEAQNESDSSENDKYRVLKGVMRVGFISKGLLLKTDKFLHLVMLCLTKPTIALLERVASELRSILINYKIDINIANACLNIHKLYYNVQLSFTSSEYVNDSPDTNSNQAFHLPKQVCLEHLTEIKRARWFQEQLLPISNALLILRILRDYCQRDPVWSVLNTWTLEVLVSKCFLHKPFERVGHKFRSIIEAIASGILSVTPQSNLNKYLLDPCESCEKIVNDYLTVQQSECITASAQHMLRLIAFKQIYKTLEINRLEVQCSSNNANNSS